MDLTTLFWKQLVGQNITIDDLEEVDKPLCDIIRFIENCSKELFDESFFESYTTMLSNQTTVDLIKGGSKIKVKYEDRVDYIQRVIQTRLNESTLQVEAIKKGLLKLIPYPFLSSKN